MNSQVIKPAANILWARPIDRPSFIPQSRPRGAKAQGLRYERRFAEYLKPMGCIHGQWFEFETQSDGIRYCQTDLIYPISRWLFAVIEVKYSLVDRAYDQLLDLYGPVVEAAYATRVGLVHVFKNNRHGRVLTHSSIEEAAQFSIDTGGVGLLRWVGQPVTPSPKTNSRVSSILEGIAESSRTAARVPHGPRL
jgi:hypothetical protein